MLSRFGLRLLLECGSTLIQHTWNAVENAVVDNEHWLEGSPPSLRYGGHQPSLKLRLASRSFSEGWWRWRESALDTVLQTKHLQVFQ